MVEMQHPNGCTHTVRDDLVEKFLSAGWEIKAAHTEQPFPVDESAPKKRKPRSKK